MLQSIAVHIASLLLLTQNGSAQTIKAPNGELYIGMSLEEAEHILQVQGRVERDGAIRVEAAAGDRSYRAYFGKQCHPLPCSKAAAGAISVGMWQQASGMEPTEAAYQGLVAEYRSASQGHNVRHFPLCQRWVVDRTTITLGVICGRLAVNATTIQYNETFRFSGSTPCTNSCF